jgi:hypothetical protein
VEGGQQEHVQSEGFPIEMKGPPRIRLLFVLYESSCLVERDP